VYEDNPGQQFMEYNCDWLIEFCTDPKSGCSVRKYGVDKFVLDRLFTGEDADYTDKEKAKMISFTDPDFTAKVQAADSVIVFFAMRNLSQEKN